LAPFSRARKRRGSWTNKRLIGVSNYLSKNLRHPHHQLGLTLRPGRWVPLSDLLAAADQHCFAISHDELVEGVATNDKRRFSFDEIDDLRWASQGRRVEAPATRGDADLRGALSWDGRAVPAGDPGRGFA
jgi:putative RNA 2'-phosphotransferase